MRGRLERGRRNKALRGELFHSVPWGYMLLPDGTVVLDPDEQVRATVRRLFETFQTLGSAYAVLRELRRHDVKLPKRDDSGQLVWRLATPTIVRTALDHPLYAGAYSWGRRQTLTHVDPTGRISNSRRERGPAEWTVLLHDRVPAYITWDQYLANQQQLLQNQRRPETKGTPGGGSALLAGLLFCGCCGNKMQVEYRSTQLGRYCCSRQRIVTTDKTCGVAASVETRRSWSLARSAAGGSHRHRWRLSFSAIEHMSQQRRQERDATAAERRTRPAYLAQALAERQYQNRRSRESARGSDPGSAVGNGALQQEARRRMRTTDFGARNRSSYRPWNAVRWRNRAAILPPCGPRRKRPRGRGRRSCVV